MKQFNPYQFYTWGQSIHPAAELSTQVGQKVKDVIWPLWTAKSAAAEISLQSLLPMPLSSGSAADLWRALLPIVPEDLAKVDMDRDVPFHELWAIKNAATKFETLLSAELQGANTFSVLQKGIYNTADLVERASNALGEATKTISKEAQDDFAAAGRCLAFELPTASGFHTMRATESVLRQYHRLLTGLAAHKRSPEMATCVEQLKKCKEDDKLLEPLDHIRGLHRNPLMHPEDFLVMDEALQLFDIAKSAIASMAKRIVQITNDPSIGTAARAALAAAPSRKKGKP